MSGTSYRDYIESQILRLPDGTVAGGFWDGRPVAPGPRATGYLEDHPDVITGLLDGLVDTIDTINADPAAAQTETNDGIEAITQNRLADETIAGAFEHLTFTVDPIASSLQGSADDAIAVGLLDDVDLTGIYDLSLLNDVLAERGLEPVSDALTAATTATSEPG